MLKQRTWGTAAGHEGSGYDIYNFMDRTTGFEFDNSGVPWGCQVEVFLFITTCMIQRHNKTTLQTQQHRNTSLTTHR